MVDSSASSDKKYPNAYYNVLLTLFLYSYDKNSTDAKWGITQIVTVKIIILYNKIRSMNALIYQLLTNLCAKKSKLCIIKWHKTY